MVITALRTMSLLDAELVAFRVGHDDMFGPSWLLDLLENCGAELPEPGNLAVAVVRTGVQIKVQSVLDRLGLGHLLEQQPPAQPDPGALLNRIVWMPYGLERPQCGSVIHGHNRVLRDRASTPQPFDEHAVVLQHVAERGGPEGGLGVRVRAVDDDLPVECHVPQHAAHGSSCSQLGGRPGPGTHTDPMAFGPSA